MKQRFKFFVSAGAWLWAPFLYLASIWQRPLFLPEYIGTDFFGFSPFFVRLPWTIFALSVALIIVVIGRLSGRTREGKIAASIWLTTPAVFLTFTMPGICFHWWQAWLGAIPWLLLLPVVATYFIRSFSNKKTMFLLLAAFLSCVIVSVIGAIFCSYLHIVSLLIYSLILGFCIVRLEESDSPFIKSIINLLSGVALGGAVFVFVLQLGGRFGITMFAKHQIYSMREPFFIPVFAGLVAAVWWRMAAVCDVFAIRTWYFLVGIGFILLSINISIPLKVIRSNAPAVFLRTAVQNNINVKNVFFVADCAMRPVVKEVFDMNAVLLDNNTLPSIMRMIRDGKKDFYVVVSNACWRNIIHGVPRIWRSGRFMVLGWPMKGAGDSVFFEN